VGRRSGDGSGPRGLFALIHSHHYVRRWHGRGYRSIDLDGWLYWIIAHGTVINRKPSVEAG